MYSLIEQRKDMNEDDVCEWERAHETIDNSKWHGVRAHCSGVRLRHLFWLASFVNQIDTVFAALCTYYADSKGTNVGFFAADSALI